MKQRKTYALDAAQYTEIRYTPSDIIQEIQNNVFMKGLVRLRRGTNLLEDSRICKVIVEGKQRAKSD